MTLFPSVSEEAGNSQATKLINNLIFGVIINALTEGLNLTNEYNLPHQEILNLLEVSTGDSWVARTWDEVSQ